MKASAWVPALIVGAVLANAARMALFVHHNTVDLVFWDQWDFLNPLFQNEPWWRSFFYQHGPHRQGMGGLLLIFLCWATHWNTRAFAFAALVCVVLATCVALLIVKRTTGKLRALDVAVPALFITFQMSDSYSGTPNPAHGPLPLLFMLLLGLAFTLRNERWRLAAIVVLDLCLLFTGFGLFMGVIIPAVLVLWLVARWREPERRWLTLAALFFCCVWLAAFAHGYVFQPAAPEFRFPDPHPERYPAFLALLFTRPFGNVGTRGLRVPISFLVLFVFIGVFGWAVARTWKSRGDQPVFLIAATFIGFALLFGVNTAVGRVFEGIDGAQAPRYVPYLLPAIFAVYLVVRTSGWSERAVTVALALLLVVFIGKEALGRPQAMQDVEHYYVFKTRWKACYLAHEDAPRCDRETGFIVYPADPPIEAKLRFLKAHKLSLFRE